MMRLEEHIEELPGRHLSGSRSELERLTLETATLVRLADINRLSVANESNDKRETLNNFLEVLTARLPAISNALTATYFRSAEIPHQLVQLRSRSES
jgi:uncharacterized alpha-E superfamily protein